MLLSSTIDGSRQSQGFAKQPMMGNKVLWRFALARNASPGQYQAEIGGYPGNVRLSVWRRRASMALEQ